MSFCTVIFWPSVPVEMLHINENGSRKLTVRPSLVVPVGPGGVVRLDDVVVVEGVPRVHRDVDVVGRTLAADVQACAGEGRRTHTNQTARSCGTQTEL